MKKEKDKLKILYIVTAFPRNEEDPITPWLTETIKRLNDKNLQIDVFTSAYKGLRRNKISGIDVFRFRYFFKTFENLTHEEMTLERMKKGGLYKILPFFYVLFGSIGIFFHCRKRKYDIIHVHWPFPHFLFGYLASRICKCPLVSTFHSVELIYLKRTFIRMDFFINWVVKKSNIITVNSSYTARKLEKYSPINLKIIPFGAATENKKIVKKQRKSEYFNLLFVGRLVERKGVEYLLKAIKILKEKTKVKLTIVGDGNLKETLKAKKVQLNLSDKDVKFTGQIPREKLIDYYNNCDAFILPAIIDSKGDTEGLGVVLLEAMSFKKPVIASGVGGIVDIVKDKKTGLLVKEKSADELASAIEFLLKNPKEREDIAKNGYLFQKQNFSWENIISSLLSEYKKLINYRST